MLQGAVALYCFVLISLFYHEKREISNLIFCIIFLVYFS